MLTCILSWTVSYLTSTFLLLKVQYKCMSFFALNWSFQINPSELSSNHLKYFHIFCFGFHFATVFNLKKGTFVYSANTQFDFLYIAKAHNYVQHFWRARPVKTWLKISYCVDPSGTAEYKSMYSAKGRTILLLQYIWRNTKIIILNFFFNCLL